MEYKVIAGASSCSYDIDPKDILTFSDLVLLVKYDAVTIISQAIQKKQLQPFFCHK